MKQTTKLLSLILALVMAFSGLSVIGSAALVQGQVAYDAIDDAQLTPEQVADLALDLVDNDLLADMETIELSVLGELRLNKIDYIFEDVLKLRDNALWGIAALGLLGDITELDFSPLTKNLNSDWGTPYKREYGDLTLVTEHLLALIGNDNNSEILSKAAYGIGTDNGISLGGIIGGMLDLGEVGDMLADLPGFLTETVYDMLIYGSYGYDKDAEELKGTLPQEVDTLDEIADNVLYNMLTKPQDYEWVGEGEEATKVWDEHSIVSKEFAALDATTAKNMINLRTNSLFTILDNVAPIAVNEFGVPALNNNLKKGLMEAVDIEFDEVSLTTLPEDVKTAFEVNTPEYQKSYVSYIAYDKMAKSGGNWYYTTMKTVVKEDGSGNAVLDENGNEVTEKQRKYYKANMATANEFNAFINWDWQILRTDDADATEKNSIQYTNLINKYGSIVQSLNDIIGIVYNNALSDYAKELFESAAGMGWKEGSTDDALMINITNLLKFVLAEFSEKIFGEGTSFIYTWNGAGDTENGLDIADYSIIDLVAIIGPSFFEDAMPQIVLPKNQDGSYAFTTGVQIFEFGAVVIRELITGIAPEVNYDSYIFAEGNVYGGEDRYFATHTAEEWKNIILNMGVDLAYVYLEQITNFTQFAKANGMASLPAQGITEARWKNILNMAILWAVDYIGAEDKANGILKGLSYNEVANVTDPLDKLSYILNTILPLGFIGNGTNPAYSSTNYALDLNKVLNNGLMPLLTSFDLTVLTDLFGRANGSAVNILDDNSLLTSILTLVNDILGLVLPGNNILQNEAGQSLDAVVSQSSLQSTIRNLLRQLYKNAPQILKNGLPVLAMFIDGWGTEQEFVTPELSLGSSIDLSNGSGSGTVTIRNASQGVWRNYQDAAGNNYQDQHYGIIPVSVQVVDFEGNTHGTVSASGLTTSTIGYGGTGSFTFSAAGVGDQGTFARFKVGYKVTDETGAQFLNGTVFYIERAVYLNFKPSDGGTEVDSESGSDVQTHSYLYTPQYVPLSSATDYIAKMPLARMKRTRGTGVGAKEHNPKMTNQSGTVDGLTPASISATFSIGVVWSGEKTIEANDIRLFDNYTLTTTGDSKVNIAVAGSIDAAAWKAANKTSGSTTEFTYYIQGKDSSQSTNLTLVLRYYDDIYKSKLTELVKKELDNNRQADEYNTTGYAYAGKILESANTVDPDTGEKILRETNYATTGYNPEEVIPEGGEATEVTKIDRAAAWAEYLRALEYGTQVALQNLDATKSDWDFEAAYDALRVAINDVEYLKMTDEELVAAGKTENIGPMVNDLKANLESLEAATTDKFDYTDYKMYRLNRFNEARDDAQYYVNLKHDAEINTDYLDQYFDYNWMEEYTFMEIMNTAGAEIDATTYNSAGVNGEDISDKAIIMALLEDYSEEDANAKKEWQENRVIEFNTREQMDVAMASNLLTLTGQRLLYRTRGLVYKQLEDEIASAKAHINDIYGEESYTAESWARYEERLAQAEDVLARAKANGANGSAYTSSVQTSQKEIFDTKYELLVARNELVFEGDQASYAELNALIAIAEWALDHRTLYNNTAEDFGEVLAELGFERTNADGDLVLTVSDVWGGQTNLFPGSAKDVLAQAYSYEDQRKVDNAADALKHALAKLQFKGISVLGAGLNLIQYKPSDTLVEDDTLTTDVDETVTAKVAYINRNLHADDVKALFSVAADGTSDADVIKVVTTDVNYSVDYELEDGTVPEEIISGDMIAGTNATVTFYKDVDGVSIPAATVKLVVPGDINGDGAVDVLDGAYMGLASVEKANLQGCYFLAGNLAEADVREINANDYAAMINAIMGATA